MTIEKDRTIQSIDITEEGQARGHISSLGVMFNK